MQNRLKNIKQYILDNGSRYYKPLQYPTIPPTSNDLYIITTAGDRLDLLANQFYNDVRLWWIISVANQDVVRPDSFGLKPGLEIRIPSNVEDIVEQYKTLNRENTK